MKFGLGQSVPRYEDPRLLRGGGQYTDDLNRPGQARGHVLRSPHAHARIAGIDCTAARAAPGVLAVLTHDDWQADGLGVICPRWRQSCCRSNGRTGRRSTNLTGRRSLPVR